MSEIIYRLNLDTDIPVCRKQINLIKGDTSSKKVILTLTSFGEKVEINPLNCIAVLRGIKADKKVIYNSATITEAGEIEYLFGGQDASAEGDSFYEIQIIDVCGDKKNVLYSAKFKVHIADKLYNDELITSSDEFGLLEEKLNEVSEFGEALKRTVPITRTVADFALDKDISAATLARKMMSYGVVTDEFDSGWNKTFDANFNSVLDKIMNNFKYSSLFMQTVENIPEVHETIKSRHSHSNKELLDSIDIAQPGMENYGIVKVAGGAETGYVTEITDAVPTVWNLFYAIKILGLWADTEMSDTSPSPVQNKVIKKYVDEKGEEIIENIKEMGTNIPMTNEEIDNICN